MDIPVYGFDVTGFTEDDLLKCSKSIQQIKELAEKARREGLLALEDDLSSLDSFFLQQGVQLVCNGDEPDIIRAILMRLIASGGYTGVELLKRIILMEGVLGIQAGDNPRVLQTSLHAFLGEEMMKRLEAENS
ncbi:MAG: hypothetical protein ACLFR1_13700 [Spirochaetia bacterium]